MEPCARNYFLVEASLQFIFPSNEAEWDKLFISGLFLLTVACFRQGNSVPVFSSASKFLVMLSLLILPTTALLFPVRIYEQQLNKQLFSTLLHFSAVF